MTMAGELNRYRQQKTPDLPRILVAGGGGGTTTGFLIEVKPVPDNGIVNLIPAFFYYLCKERHLDPDDPKSCDRWREPYRGILTKVLGDYFYRASWPDGKH